MRSSYNKNNYGAVLQAAVRFLAPALVVELGVLDGYSTYHLANGLKNLSTNNGWGGELHAYDLFDDYEFKHGDQRQVAAMLRAKGVAEYVKLKKANAFQVHNRYEKESVDLLHIDISNDGEKLLKLFKQWHPKLRKVSGYILAEGGSKSRDVVVWMQKYNKPKIALALNDPFVVDNFKAPLVLERFPSMTILQKR